MNYFICALGAVRAGIPAERTERIIPVNRAQDSVYETRDREAFVSLPLLFRLTDLSAPHGVVLKSQEGRDVKTTLLTPKIDMDLAIQEDKIHALPLAFSGLFECFRGAYFDSQGVILILDPDKLAESAQ